MENNSDLSTEPSFVMIDTSTIKQEANFAGEILEESVPDIDPLSATFDTLPLTSKCSEGLNVEKNKTKSLRNMKLMAPIHITLKTECIPLEIETDPDSTNFIVTTDATVESHSSCSISDNNDMDSIKKENINLVNNLEKRTWKILNNDPVSQIPLPYDCKHCTFTCLCKKEFDAHYDVHIMEKPFSCHLCRYITKERRALKVHMLSHTKVKRFSCEYCDFKTSYKCSLKAHMKTHVNVKYYSCSACMFKTTYKPSMNVHMQIHTCEKQFMCDCCSFKTNDKYLYDQHMLSHAGKKSFICEQCSFKTHKKSDFREHVLSHTQPFKCQLCSYETTSKNLLSSHMVKCCVLIRPRKRIPLGQEPFNSVEIFKVEG